MNGQLMRLDCGKINSYLPLGLPNLVGRLFRQKAEVFTSAFSFLLSIVDDYFLKEYPKLF